MNWLIKLFNKYKSCKANPYYDWQNIEYIQQNIMIYVCKEDKC